jgi:hypothetical protein
MKTIFRMKLNVICEEQVKDVTRLDGKTFYHFESGGNLRDIYCFPTLEEILFNLETNVQKLTPFKPT